MRVVHCFWTVTEFAAYLFAPSIIAASRQLNVHTLQLLRTGPPLEHLNLWSLISLTCPAWHSRQLHNTSVSFRGPACSPSRCHTSAGRAMYVHAPVQVAPDSPAPHAAPPDVLLGDEPHRAALLGEACMPRACAAHAVPARPGVGHAVQRGHAGHCHVHMHPLRHACVLYQGPMLPASSTIQYHPSVLFVMLSPLPPQTFLQSFLFLKNPVQPPLCSAIWPVLSGMPCQTELGVCHLFFTFASSRQPAARTYSSPSPPVRLAWVPCLSCFMISPASGPLTCQPRSHHAAQQQTASWVCACSSIRMQWPAAIGVAAVGFLGIKAGPCVALCAHGHV